jgi:hypothetical protein
MKSILILAAALASFGLTACGDETDTTPYAEPNCKASAWQTNKIPPCTVPVSISMTDPNGVYKAGEAQWKGSFMYDAVTRVAFFAGDWNGGNGPHAPLYDDGPWTAGGHEGAGEAAGDGVFGTTIFVYPPASGSTTYEYGMIDHAFGDGWIWKGSNGTFSVAAGATAAITASPLVLDTFGTTDVQLTLDTANLEPNTCSPTPCTPAAWDFAGGIKVKGSAWGWYEVSTTNVGGVYSFTLSDFAGAGKLLYHTGLTKTGDQPQFVFVFYKADGTTSKEYKVGTGGPPTTGVTAGTKASGAATWTPATVQKQTTGDLNTFITVP